MGKTIDNMTDYRNRMAGRPTLDESIQPNSVLALRIRNLIAAREFNTAEANRELSLGGWLSDHRHEDNNLAAEIDALFEKANATPHECDENDWALDQETHKSQPEDLLLRSGAIGAGGATEMQQPTVAPPPGSNKETP